MMPMFVDPPPPWMLSEAGFVGCKTRIGIGAWATASPQTAIPRTLCLVFPASKPAKKVGMLSVTVTRRNGLAATATGGAVIPGGGDARGGKSTYTLFPRAVLPWAIGLPKPFSVAYWHAA